MPDLRSAPTQQKVARERLAMIREAIDQSVEHAVPPTESNNRTQREWRERRHAAIAMRAITLTEGHPLDVLMLAKSQFSTLGIGNDQVLIRQAFDDPTPSQIRYRCRRFAGEPVCPVRALALIRAHVNHYC